MPNPNVGLGAALHYGNTTIRLDSVRRTEPALAVGFGTGVSYGALYADNAPTGALRIGDHWLAQNCAPGTYSVDGLSACTDCGLGHYCTGGIHRAACTGGIIGCNGTTATMDAPAPALANKFLTLSDVTANVPPTDIGQWELLAWADGSGTEIWADVYDKNTINDVRSAALHQVIGPGTYLFVAHYTTGGEDVDSVTGIMGSVTTAKIAVFDHPVEYRAIHGGDIFQFFIDTIHTPYQSYTISSAALGQWHANEYECNVSGISHFRGTYLAVYELK